MMIDIDGYPIDDLTDLMRDPASMADEIIANVLPERFQARTCWWQLSSTCGFTRGVAKMHLWFWLREPRTCAEIRRWMEDNAPGTSDLAVFNPIQFHYTSRPKLVGITDPLPVRGGWLYGDEDEVDLPRPLPQEFRPRPRRVPGEGLSGGVCAALDQLGDDEAGFHRPLRTAAMQYARDVERYGRPRDDEGMMALWQTAIEAAFCKDGRRSRYMRHYYLTQLIEGAFRRIAYE
jgi:hypothetical protein